MSPERVDARGIVERLERARVEGPAGLAFDADGTLWAGDVGEDVFELACRDGLLLDAPRDGLERVAHAHGLSTGGTPSELAQRLHAAYRRGQLDELLTCEVMTWSYAGWSTAELRDWAARALAERRLVDRVRHALAPVFAFAEREGLRVIVVSASPHVIVTEALRIAEIGVAEIAAARPAVHEDVIQPALAAPVPYGPQKPIEGARLLGPHDWLGSFGDNVFDVEMLRAARVGVAVFPKPALVARLGDLTNTVVLE
jgi:phosphatidylglycerophosphatase C